MSFVPVNIPKLDGNEKKYVMDCLDTGWISSEGPYITRFETEFARFTGRKHAVAVCNGTAAIDATIVALDLQEGDEVIMPTFTIISCISEMVRRKIKPVLVDSCKETWNMSVADIEGKITNKTKAIMVVHIYSHPVDMDPVLTLAKKYNLKIIEDAAEMHGQTYKGKKCGSFGDVSTFSFYPNKHITTGEGGMIVTDSDILAERLRSLRNLCFKPGRRFVHEELGWNLRMTNIQAAIGLAQLERIEETVVAKRRIGKFYDSQFAEIKHLVELPQTSTAYSENIYWVYGMVLRDNVPLNAEKMMKLLTDEGIGCRPFFYPMHQQPVLNREGLFNGESYPVAERIAERGFYVPSGLGNSQEDLQKSADAVIRILRKF